MFIKSIKPANIKGYLKLQIDTGDGILSLLVSEGQYESISSPKLSEEITEEALSSLLSFEEYNKAKKKALNVLAFGDNSERELKTKLSRSGIKASVIESVTAEMVRLGYINEVRQLERLIENEVNFKLHGPRKIASRLMPKGYKMSDIKAVLSRLSDEGKIDLLKAKQKLIAKCETTLDAKKTLYKNGF